VGGGRGEGHGGQREAGFHEEANGGNATGSISPRLPGKRGKRKKRKKKKKKRKSRRSAAIYFSSGAERIQFHSLTFIPGHYGRLIARPESFCEVYHFPK